VNTLMTYKTFFVATVLGSLVACSTSQAPWSRPDDSPWSEKHAAAAQAAPADEVVYEQAVIEPAPVETVVVAEPEPMPVTEPESVSQAPSRFAEPMAVQAEAIVVEELSPEARVEAMPAGSYAVQVYASATMKSMEKFQKARGLDDLTVLKTDRGGKTFYVLVDLHESRADAIDAAATLEQKINGQPWVRSVAGLKKILVK